MCTREGKKCTVGSVPLCTLDVEEATTQLQGVLQEVSREAVIGVDDDVDFVTLSEQALGLELTALTAELSDVTQQVNAGLLHRL